MRLMYAVPMLALVEATNEDQAYEIVNSRVQNRLLGEVTVLIDEEIPAFAYDEDTTEVHSINDRNYLPTKPQGT